MAKLYRGSKHLKKNAHQALRRALLWTLPTLLYSFLLLRQEWSLHPVFHLIALLPLLLTLYYWRQYQIYRAGLRGEMETAKRLKRLPNSFEIYHAVPLRYQGERSEADLIVVGENGIFLIEVKNHSGHLSGAADAPNWQQVKRGKNGQEYRKAVRNPCLQLKKQVWLLAQIFQEERLPLWIEGILYLANPNCTWQIAHLHTPLFHDGEQLCHYLVHYQPQRPPTPSQLKAAKQLLRKLQQVK